ncbi:hypothetical protein N9242_01210 [Vicingaceae bacterium]|nr:hypothetical protein [Vicingaceae bacterium]
MENAAMKLILQTGLCAFLIGCMFLTSPTLGQDAKENAARSAKKGLDENEKGKGKDRRKRTQQRDSRSQSPVIDREREEQLLKFVRTHHAELIPLLKSLKKRKPANYQRTLADLRRSVTKIVNLKTRDSDRYETELVAWQLRSRVELLTAQLAVRDSVRIRKQLRETLLEQAKLRRKQLTAEKERLEKRLAVVENQLSRDDGDVEKEIDRRMQASIRNARKFKSDRSKLRKIKTEKKTNTSNELKKQ